VYLLDVNVVLAAYRTDHSRHGEADALGDLVLAALAVEHSCTVVTLDRDFARFPSVRRQLLASTS
jgi:predicted nucleic acid-binding protein